MGEGTVGNLSYQSRIDRALAWFEEVNKLEPPDGPYVLPSEWASTGSLSALVTLLIEAGIIDVHVWIERTLANQVEILEHLVATVAEDYRKKTGVMLSLGLVGRPQG